MYRIGPYRGVLSAPARVLNILRIYAAAQPSSSTFANTSATKHPVKACHYSCCYNTKHATSLSAQNAIDLINYGATFKTSTKLTSKISFACFRLLLSSPHQHTRRYYATSAKVASSSNEPFQTLKAAIKELSGENYFMVSVSSPEDLIAWNEKPAESLDVDQLEELARALFEGSVNGLEPNVEKAIELWQIASKLGSTEAHYCLASCVRDGVVFEEDPATAFKMFEELTSKCDFPMAHYMIGLMYNRGLGVTQDQERAFRCFKTATDKGITRAYYELSTFYDSGKIVPKNEQLAVKCLEVAVEGGDLLAKHALGLHFYKGIGCAVDRSRAYELQLQAADGGHPAAMFNVAVHYLSGEGIPDKKPDVVKAVEYFEKARERGIIEAAINLVGLYRGNHGHPKELSKARSLIKSFYATNEEFKSILREIELEIEREKQAPKIL